MITQSELKFIINYDHESGEFTWRNPHKQGPAKVGAKAGTIKWCGSIGSKRPYLYIHFGRKWYRAHRLAWLYMTGEWPDDQIDHINTDTLDNRFCNLRQATQRQNNYNQNINSKNTSGVKGVSWGKTRNLWMARTKIDGKAVNLGRFSTIEAAEKKVREAREKWHKEFHNHG